MNFDKLLNSSIAIFFSAWSLLLAIRVFRCIVITVGGDRGVNVSDTYFSVSSSLLVMKALTRNLIMMKSS